MHRCIECSEIITNPICPECLSEGIACWVGEKMGPQAAQAVFEQSKILAYKNGDTRCIKCHKKMGLCVYCFTNNLISILENDPRVLAQFLFYFTLEHLKIKY